MIIINAMAVILLLLLICSLGIALLEIYDLLEELYLEIKSKFEFPKHKDKFLIKKGNKYIWVYK